MSDILSRQEFEEAWENRIPMQYRPIVVWRDWTSVHKPAFETSVEFRINPNVVKDDE